jgi:hypothetical protein
MYKNYRTTYLIERLSNKLKDNAYRCKANIPKRPKKENKENMMNLEIYFDLETNT